MASLVSGQRTFGAVHLVTVDPPGDAALMSRATGVSTDLSVNTRHPYVQGPLDARKVYGLVCQYYQLLDVQRALTIKKADGVEERIRTEFKYLTPRRPAVKT